MSDTTSTLEAPDANAGPLKIYFPPLTGLPEVGQPLHELSAGLFMALDGDPDVPPFDTNGYDTVYTQRVGDVNAEIVAHKISPTSFQASDTSVLVGDYSAMGTFSDWQLTLGGSGPILCMAIPVTTGTLTIKNTGATFPMDNSTASIQVHAQYLPQSPTNNGTPNNLVLQTDPPVVEVLELTFAGTAPDSGVVDLMKTCLQDWFNANLVQFDYVFNVANLNMTAAKGQFQWLMPTKVDYAYQDGRTADTSYFATLAMVTPGPWSGYVQQINASAIPGDSAHAAFSISSARVLSQIVLPSLAQSWNVDKSYFKLSNNNTEIDNTQNIPLAGVKVGAITYNPEITTLNVSINATQLVITSLIHTNVSPGIDSYVSNTAYLTLALKTGTDGTQYLTYASAKPALTNHWMETATWIIVTEAIVAVVGLIAAGVASVVLEGVALVVALVVIGIVAGLAAATPQIIAAVMNGAIGEGVPNLGDLVTAATDTVSWPGSSGLTLSEVVLNGALQLVGNPTPA